MFELREATRADAWAIDEITVEAWRTSFSGSVPADVLEGQQVGARADYFRSRLPSETPYQTTVAVEGETVIGYVHVAASRDDDGIGLPEISALYVSPRHHRKGVGRALVHHAMQWISATGSSEVTLWTLRDVASTRRFYEALGGRCDLEKSEEIRGHDLPHVRYRFQIS